MIDALTTEDDVYEDFADIGLLTFGDGLTVTVAKVKDPSQLVITWDKGHRRLFLDSREARQLASWIKASLPALEETQHG